MSARFYVSPTSYFTATADQEREIMAAPSSVERRALVERFHASSRQNGAPMAIVSASRPTASVSRAPIKSNRSKPKASIDDADVRGASWMLDTSDDDKADEAKRDEARLKKLVAGLKEKAARGDKQAREMLEYAKTNGWVDADDDYVEPGDRGKKRDDESRVSTRARSIRSPAAKRVVLSDEAKLQKIVARLKTLLATGTGDQKDEAIGQLGYLVSVGFIDFAHNYIPQADRERRAKERAELAQRMGVDGPVVGVRRNRFGNNEYGVVFDSQNVAKRR